MPSLAALTSLVLLASSNLVAAQINAPDCSLLWDWVWFCVFRGFYDELTVENLSRSIPLAKMHVRSQRISCRPVTMVVSSGLLFFVCRPLCSQSLPAFTINALLPGQSYTGPTAIDGTNMCKCNTVAYNLLSACDACQGAVWIPCARLPLPASIHWLMHNSAGPNT